MKINFIIDNAYPERVHDTEIWIETACQGEIEYEIFNKKDELNKNLKYTYILFRQGYPSFDLRDGIIKIDDDVVKKYNQGYNINFVFATGHESDAPDCVQTISNYCKSLGIEETDLFIYNGNSQLPSTNNTDVNVFPNDLILKAMSQSMFINGNYKEFKTERENTFQCYNRVEKIHRLIISTFLYKHNLLKDTDFSLRSSQAVKELLKNNQTYFNHLSGPILDKKVQDEYTSLLTKLVDTDAPIYSRYENFDFDSNGPQHNLTHKSNVYEKSYINIVNETQYEWDGIIHITEKSTAPLWFFQVPIIVATPNHVKKMKELYDFDFFDDLVNHSYDSEENHKYRMHKIQREILRLHKNRTTLPKFFEKNEDRFRKNREIIMKILDSNEDLNFIKSLL